MSLFAGVVGLWIWGFWASARARRDIESIGESQRRLTQAEQDLEGALRVEFLDSLGVTQQRVDELRARRGETALPNATAAEAGRSFVAPQHLALAELWAATHARLELYHKIATGQARQSFRNAQVAMVMGFVLLVAFVVVALNASTTAGSIVAGGLGAVSAALAGYVSHTFVRSQEAAAGHLRSYFDQPLELSRFLAAERLIADGKLSDEQRAEVLMTLVQAMVAGPPQPPVADAASIPAQPAGR